jgi:hypothetical protein
MKLYPMSSVAKCPFWQWRLILKKASRKPLADDAISSIRPQPRQVKINVDAAFPAEISLKEWLVLLQETFKVNL